MIKQKKLLLRCADDSVIVMAFVLDDGFVVSRQGTDDEIRAEIERLSIAWPIERLPILGWEEIDESHLPERTFRNAWTTRGGKTIGHDMTKARDIHLGRIRAKRDAKLDELDREWMKNAGQGKNAEAKAVEDKRQALRDIPDTWADAINGAETVEELLGMWPEELER